MKWQCSRCFKHEPEVKRKHGNRCVNCVREVLKEQYQRAKQRRLNFAQDTLEPSGWAIDMARDWLRRF